jgi:hypothetical protein
MRAPVARALSPQNYPIRGAPEATGPKGAEPSLPRAHVSRAPAPASSCVCELALGPRALALAGALARRRHAGIGIVGKEAACRARLRLTPFRLGLTNFVSLHAPAGRLLHTGPASSRVNTCQCAAALASAAGGRTRGFVLLSLARSAAERDGAVLARDQHGRKEVDEILSRSGGERCHVLSRSALVK